MSESDSPPDGPSDSHEFHQALSELVRTARANSVEVFGGWRIEGADEAYDLSVEILSLVPREVDEPEP